jgi:chaperonin GroEL
MTSEPKEFRFEEEARHALRDGINQLADAVEMTLGPRGRTVGIDNSWGSPTITNDGHTIAKDIELKDPFQNMGASMAKEVAAKIKEKAGDGTTTGILLLRALVQEGVKNISAGANPTAIKRGMDKGLEKALSAIEALSTQVKEIKDIATVSASGHPEIGAVMAEAFTKVGKKGVVSIEEGKGTETHIDLVKGMQFDRGYASPYFCTNAEKMSVEMDHPFVLITDKKISSAQEILPILQYVAGAGLSLFIIADDIDGDALSTLVMNKLRGTLKVAAAKAPAFGDRRKAILEDLAILTGAQLISEERGLLLRDATAELLGRADQIILTKETTTIVGGQGDAKLLKARIAQIDHEIKEAAGNSNQEKLEERRAKLQGGVAVIQVGAPTESEMKQKKQMYEDSLHSTRAALEEGIVAGGGVALLHAAKALETLRLSDEEAVGVSILRKACSIPFQQIVSNAGFDPAVLLDEILSKKGNMGFNALTEKVEDLLKSGVVDPTKVVKSSLMHAVSVAGVALLSEALMA